jgi:hypothetical protein
MQPSLESAPLTKTEVYAFNAEPDELVRVIEFVVRAYTWVGSRRRAGLGLRLELLLQHRVHGVQALLALLDRLLQRLEVLPEELDLALVVLDRLWAGLGSGYERDARMWGGRAHLLHKVAGADVDEHVLRIGEDAGDVEGVRERDEDRLVCARMSMRTRAKNGDAPLFSVFTSRTLAIELLNLLWAVLSWENDVVKCSNS